MYYLKIHNFVIKIEMQEISKYPGSVDKEGRLDIQESPKACVMFYF